MGTGPQGTLEPFHPLSVDGSTKSALVRQRFMIALLSDGPQTVVDNLVLQATSVPEPASVALLALGAALLTLKVRGRHGFQRVRGDA